MHLMLAMMHGLGFGLVRIGPTDHMMLGMYAVEKLVWALRLQRCT